MDITYDEAVELLTNAKRSELRDHFFGDKEVYFTSDDDRSIAEGYSGNSAVSIMVQGTEFTGDQAAELLTLGTLVAVERNDSDTNDE